jgi:hypothetical protein
MLNFMKFSAALKVFYVETDGQTHRQTDKTKLISELPEMATIKGPFGRK